MIAFLEGTGEGLGEHGGVFVRYGVENFEDLKALDEACIGELAAALVIANVKPLNVNEGPRD